MNQHLYNTPLSNRTLWFDGISSFNPSQIIELIGKGTKVDYVDFLTPEIIEYNKKANNHQQIQEKNECSLLNLDWNLPEEYATLNVIDYISKKHSTLLNGMDEDEAMSREVRLANELIKYKKANLINVLRTIIYIINTLTSCEAVWGVGRGSSVSSYVLYVIGVHDVDSFKYELDIDDFLHN